MRYNNLVRTHNVSLIIVLLFSSLILAQNKEDNFLSKIKFNAFLSAGYEYNFNTPSDAKNSLRIFDTDHNSFKTDVFQFSFHQDIEESAPFGFRADIVTGSSIPRAIRSAGMNSGDLDVMQMYVSYLIPVGSGLRIDFGKFATFLGYELIENWEGYNDNHTRSFSFGYSIPFTHTGIKAGYAFSNCASLSLFIVNGWDNAVDNNKSKSVGAQLALMPAERLNIYANFMTGPEQDNNDSNYRSIFDFVSVYNVNDLTFGANVNFGSEEFTSAGNTTAKWSSFAGYLKYRFSGLFSIALRGELFRDENGARTGTEQDLSEFTITPAFTLSDHIILRGDVRFDSSDKETFVKNSGYSKNQSTLSCNLIYHF